MQTKVLRVLAEGDAHPLGVAAHQALMGWVALLVPSACVRTACFLFPGLRTREAAASGMKSGARPPLLHQYIQQKPLPVPGAEKNGINASIRDSHLAQAPARKRELRSSNRRWLRGPGQNRETVCVRGRGGGNFLTDNKENS